MLIPYKDTNPTKKFSIITLFLIILNVAAFYFQAAGNFNFNFTEELALIPAEIITGKNLDTSQLINPYVTVITYMFLHGGLLHLGFNMLFLWIFGNNIEDRMSAHGYIFFYLLTGAISGLAFSIAAPEATIPLVGASGAISGILGAYLFMFPFARIHAFLFIFRIKMPALVFIVLWFISQISGILSTAAQSSNIAWMAHIAGFIAGIALFKLFVKKA
ncbi:MAG: rhomboid family intramembrane serine protease [Spirochaetes bacterium]|nr:rhomboid family intramembrane serine protease [Spirochaetota bacterium]